MDSSSSGGLPLRIDTSHVDAAAGVAPVDVEPTLNAAEDSPMGVSDLTTPKTAELEARIRVLESKVRTMEQVKEADDQKKKDFNEALRAVDQENKDLKEALRVAQLRLCAVEVNSY